MFNYPAHVQARGQRICDPRARFGRRSSTEGNSIDEATEFAVDAIEGVLAGIREPEA
jgi:hypothetical protein